MRQLCSALLVILITGTSLYAQPPGRGGNGMRGEARERIHAAKMAYITDRLHLTQAQSGDFIPVYNEFEQEVRALRKSYFGKYCKGAKPEDGDRGATMKHIDADLDYQTDVIALKRKYNDRFLKVLSAQQVTEVYEADKEFRQMLQKRLKEREMQR